MLRRRDVVLAAAGLAAPVGAAFATAAPVAGEGAREALRHAVAEAIAQGAAQAPLTHAVLVEQGNRLLAEAYFSADDKPSGAWFAQRVAFDAGTLHDLRSVTKSVVALLAGIAHGRGELDLERPVMDWFPEHAALATPERRALRLEHLLTMTAGFAWDESGVAYGKLGNSETRLGLSADPVAHVLSRDMVAAPGSRFVYSGGATLLLGEIVERATGRPIDELARESLFTPLGITRYAWRHHAVWGKALPYSGLRLTPLSMLRLGRLVLDGGRHGDQAVVPAAWLAEMQKPRVTASGHGLRYGWQWWVGRVAQGPAAGIGWFAGLGNGGQVLMAVPALDAAIVVTAGRYNTPASSAPSLAICRRVVEALRG